MAKSNNIDSKPPNSYLVFVIIGCAGFLLFLIIRSDNTFIDWVTLKPLKEYIDKRFPQEAKLKEFKEVSLNQYSTATHGMIDTSSYLTNFVCFTYDIPFIPHSVAPRFHSLPCITAIWLKDISCVFNGKELDLRVGDNLVCDILGKKTKLYINYLTFNFVWLTEQPISDINFAYKSLPEIDDIVSYNGRPYVVYNDDEGKNVYYTTGGQVRVDNSIITIEDICEEVGKKVFFGNLSFTNSDLTYSFFCYIIPDKNRIYSYEN